MLYHIERNHDVEGFGCKHPPQVKQIGLNQFVVRACRAQAIEGGLETIYTYYPLEALGKTLDGRTGAASHIQQSIAVPDGTVQKPGILAVWSEDFCVEPPYDT